MKKFKENLIEIFFLVAGFVTLVPVYVFAAPNYGQNFGKFALDQLFWVAAVILAFSLVSCLAKRNVTGIIVSIIIGVIVIGVIKDPTGLQDMGTQLWNTLKG